MYCIRYKWCRNAGWGAWQTHDWAEELAQMVAELAANQREQAVVAQRWQEELQVQTELHLQRMENLAAQLRSWLAPPPTPPVWQWRRTGRIRRLCLCRPQGCDQRPFPPLTWEPLGLGRGQCPFLRPRRKPRSRQRWRRCARSRWKQRANCDCWLRRRHSVGMRSSQ